MIRPAISSSVPGEASHSNLYTVLARGAPEASTRCPSSPGHGILAVAEFRAAVIEGTSLARANTATTTM